MTTRTSDHSGKTKSVCKEISVRASAYKQSLGNVSEQRPEISLAALAESMEMEVA